MSLMVSPSMQPFQSRNISSPSSSRAASVAKEKINLQTKLNNMNLSSSSEITSPEDTQSFNEKKIPVMQRSGTFLIEKPTILTVEQHKEALIDSTFVL